MKIHADVIIAILQQLKQEGKTPAIKRLLAVKGFEFYKDDLGSPEIFWDCCNVVYSRKNVYKERRQMLDTFNVIGRIEESDIAGYYHELKEKFLSRDKING